MDHLEYLGVSKDKSYWFVGLMDASESPEITEIEVSKVLILANDEFKLKRNNTTELLVISFP